MANIPAKGKNLGTGLYLAYSDFVLGLLGIRFKPAPPPFDGSHRPPGWAGHWSEAYGRLLAYTFTEDPPFSKPAREVIANAPRPLQEALEPLASSAELIDRNGRTLPWQWSRSLTADLLGPTGVALAVLCLATMLGGVAISLLKLPPLMDDAPPPAVDKAAGQLNERRKSDAPGSQPPVQTAPPSATGPTAGPSLPEQRPTEQSKTPVDKAPEQSNERRKSDAPGTLPPPPAVPPSPPSQPTGKPRS